MSKPGTPALKRGGIFKDGASASARCQRPEARPPFAAVFLSQSPLCTSQHSPNYSSMFISKNFMSIWTLKGHDELWGKSPFGIWTGFNLSFGECLCCIALSLLFFQADSAPLRKALGGLRKALYTSQVHSLLYLLCLCCQNSFFLGQWTFES